MAFFLARALAPRAIVTERMVGMAIGRPPTNSTSMLFSGAHEAFTTPAWSCGKRALWGVVAFLFLLLTCAWFAANCELHDKFGGAAQDNYRDAEITNTLASRSNDQNEVFLAYAPQGN